ncbi:MAG TPA: AbrB/MazE/SpoVT family DNA-binding domain-containing protein [Thermoplasmata archaeon]
MQTVTVDRKGRVLIPKEQREELGLTEEDQLSVAVEGGEIRLKPITRKQYKAKSGRKWGKEAFLKAGEASFADEE